MGFAKIKILREVGIEDYLQTAVDTAAWLKSKEIITENGKRWEISGNPVAPLSGEESAFLSERGLYAGAAGIAYYLVQLYQVTGNEGYLKDAEEAANYLINTYQSGLASNPGIHSGVSGEGLFLYLLYEVTGNEPYKKQAIAIADDAYEQAVKEQDGIHWSGLFDYMGDAGVIAYWLFLFEKTQDGKYLEYARLALESILKITITREDGSVFWNLFDPSGFFTVLPKGGIVPNFAHGTAGIVYLLTKFYEASKEDTYLEYAKKGIQFLKSIAITEEDSSIVPYLYFDKEKAPYDTFYLGYCHGPVGDAIAVKELYRATGETEYLEFYNCLTNALIKAGVPHRKSSGYWNDCLCCGSAGVLIHFLDAYRLTGNEEFLELAKKTANKTVTDAYRDEEGARWYNAWTRVKPWEVDAHLGLFVGAAGSASVLLSLYAHLKDIEISELFEYAK